MQRLWLGGVVAAMIVSAGALAHAEGKGKGAGLARALSKAGGQGSASAGLGRASQNVSRAGGSLGRSGLSKSGVLKSRALSSLPAGTAPTLTDAAARHQQQLLIEQRNRDHRLAQAQHLRDIAARNGDADLAANAERMATFAQEHYEARVAQLGRFGVTDPALAPPVTPMPELPPPPAEQPPVPTAP